MFLFEEFIYDKEWAEKYYGGSFKHNNWYLESIINDDELLKKLARISREELERFNFSVSRYTEIPNVNNLYKITYFTHYASKPDPPFQKDQIDYLKNKLSILGDAVKIIVPHFEATMIIQYFIEKDEYRWNKVHDAVKAHEDKLNELSIPEPSIESWIWMCNAYYNNKNPRIIFKKFKNNLNQQLEFIVIAYKLNWINAADNIISQLYNCFGDGRFISDNTSKGKLYGEAAKKYADNYQLDEEIQELINSYKVGVKNDQNVPTKLKPITQILDIDSRVAKYTISRNSNWSQYTTIYLIKVEMDNGNIGWINLSRYNDHYYQLASYNTDDIKKICREEKTYRLSKELQIARTVKELNQLYTEKCIDAIY